MCQAKVRGKLVCSILNQITGKAIVPGFYRSVGRENTFLPCPGRSFFQGRAGAQFFPHELQGQKSRMPLIHVESRGLDTQSAQESHASHTQEDFLHDACAAVPSVDAHGEIPIQLLVFRKIGIHQVEEYVRH